MTKRRTEKPVCCAPPEKGVASSTGGLKAVGGSFSIENQILPAQPDGMHMWPVPANINIQISGDPVSVGETASASKALGTYRGG